MLWGAQLSPFALKVEALLRFAGVRHRWMPRDGGFREALGYQVRLRRVVSGSLPLTWPPKTPLDEFPLVPFLFGPQGENLYDSSAIAQWLDLHVPRVRDIGGLVPAGDSALRFVVHLVDEALDEVGLYLVHHNRWVVAARDNGAGRRLAEEMRPLAGPAAALLARNFPPRQVRRLPYLFSVADSSDRRFSDLPQRLRPPSRPGFPATHRLLEQAFAELLAAIEPVLAARPFLFGERFTLADASLYGQLGMNRSDPSAWAWIVRDAPATARWIERLARGDFEAHRPSAELQLDTRVQPLLGWLAQTFVPLMQQNREAFARQRAEGGSRFNERAFDANVWLYEGSLLGQPFRSVAKSFQVRVWNSLCDEWRGLPGQVRSALAERFPAESIAALGESSVS